MAQMDVAAGDSGHKKGPGVKKSKKLSTRVDMTPMVDLGFLLITFFIYTTTMSTPNTTKLNMPKKEEDKTQQMEVEKSGLLTILLGKGDQIYYYEGELKPDGSNFMTSSYDPNSEQGIRKVLQKKKAQVIAAWTPNPAIKDDSKDRAFTVIIKPSKEANYGRTVDILDEMTINNISRYAIIDISDPESTVLNLASQRNGGK
ncbi:ExbD/TolR family protein [Flavisolibacter ginsenosidimutans]|uniref:Biopolymer transporter ExbD n=1 Tax=Flavisolibacter ginsenosidimutans TaxID=661481 RepID=A0A5B8UIX1_9BACT|nr:biopolymer transporter ExbD [Flavisolibacter ginsenosidimutans]QEC56528.1 biopolymer transporter ExbD [Flavisolibacter ginsenosidimutans]